MFQTTRRVARALTPLIRRRFSNIPDTQKHIVDNLNSLHEKINYLGYPIFITCGWVVGQGVGQVTLIKHLLASLG